MPSLLPLLLTLSFLIAPGIACAQDTLYWEASQLQRAKREAAAPTASLAKTLDQLRLNADAALGQGPFSVTHKKMAPPSGDLHDYASYSRYWWPDPDKPDGLPYIRRDGESNQELLKNGDRLRLGRLADAVRALTLASHFFEEPRYADRATQLIRVWFLDPATKMNPNLNYAQAIPGRADGRSLGVIDTRDFITILDAVAVLRHQGRMPVVEQQGLHQWFAEFFEWLRTSKLGRGEAAARNNHGTWHDAQAARIAFFVGEEAAAREILEHAATERVAEQFTPDGAQPDELRRAQTLHYTYFNLEAFSVLARLGEHVGIDFWKRSRYGIGLEPGIRYVAPYTHSRRPWPFRQTHDFSLSLGGAGLLRMASARYGDPSLLIPISKTRFGHLENEYAELLFGAVDE